MTGKPNWQEDLSNKKTQVARRHNWQHPNDKKNQVTKRPKWQEHPKLQQEQEPTTRKTTIPVPPVEVSLNKNNITFMEWAILEGYKRNGSSVKVN